MNRFLPVSEEEVALSVTGQLLGVFRTMYPTSVEEALTLFRKGQSLQEVGEVILTTIQTTQDKLLDAAEKIGILQETISGLKKQLLESEKNLTQIESQNKKVQYENEIQADELIDLKDTVMLQNKILARQQQKLQNLLGNSVDDE